MKTPKKPVKKSPLVDDDAEMDESNEQTTDKNYDDEDYDFDVPLDDLDNFDTYGADDDDDDY